MKHHSVQREYWRSLEHLANTPEMRQLAENEFASYEPDGMISMPPLTRRRFMQLVGASMALAGLTLSGCRRWPEEKLAPYTSNPKNRIPGVPVQYATIMELGGIGVPLLVTSFDGRPIKIEGNPTHPYSATVADRIGAADSIAQASILEMYDPDRSRTILTPDSSGRVYSDWETFAKKMQPVLSQLDAKKGDGLAILSESTVSPTNRRMKSALMTRYPSARWYEYEALSRDNESAGVKTATGVPSRIALNLDRAAVILSFDADILGTHPAHIRYASDWAKTRATADHGKMSRMYMVESAFSTTGTVADVRYPTKPSRIGAILAGVAGRLGVGLGQANATLPSEEQAFVNRVSEELMANRGEVVIVVGSHLAPEYHALALAMNAALGAIGSTLSVMKESADDRMSHMDGIADLSRQMKAGGINTLVILGGNPAYDAPADVDFAGSLKSVANSVHLSLYDNETSKLCTWHVPKAHYLESWSDARAWDGTASVCQPLIEPLYDGKTNAQMLAFLAGSDETDTDAMVRKTFAEILPADDFDNDFRHVLHDGLQLGTEFEAFLPAMQPSPSIAPPAESSGFEARFLQDLSLYDGRFAGNGWLQEMPDPLTKVVWDNAALLSKKDADQLGITTGDMVKITIGANSLEIVAYVLPGQPIGVIGLPLGYGRAAAGHIGTAVGFNTYTLRTTSTPYSATGVQIARTGNTYLLTTTQNHHLMDKVGMDGRAERVGEDKYENSELIRESTLEEYKKSEGIFIRKADGDIALQLFDPPREDNYSDDHKWGMAIDMNSCIGCHACVIACQAENNIPIVGKDQVEKNRQMHWIRIDRYFKGEVDEPEVVYQPVTCQQCENAPCEQVCPVGATMHDTEGLNVMVYNRCVGTRYCSNNCPYKVRRFNYLDFHSQDPRNDKYPKPYLNIPDQQQLETFSGDKEVQRMVFNPEVTVRMRGVMEKCTYCIQRIHTTQTAKRAAGQELADGDIVTACQQACPTRAIVFGDLNDRRSKVSQLHRNSRAYQLLGDLNTRPRNRYLAKISNPSQA
jgi:MoCo/4Fe-4S cofactor protein with predicted Tat translocation signal